MNDPGTDRSAEPDYRFTLANERTFLAWVRTALALLAAAVALGHLVPGFGPVLVRKVGAAALAVLAAMTAVTGVVRWSRVQTALERGAPMPRARFSWVISLALMGVAVVLTVVILAGNGGGS